MSYKASDPVSVLTFLSPSELDQVQKLGPTLGDLKHVDEFQWGETDLSAVSLDRLTHALSNLASADPTPGNSIEMNAILHELDQNTSAEPNPLYTGYHPKKFTRPSVPELLKPSGKCFTFWIGVWGLFGLLLFVPFMIPAATTTVSQGEFALLDFSKYDCKVTGREWIRTKYGGYWTFQLEVPGEDYQFWDRLNGLSTWTLTTQEIAISVPCWYASNSDGSYRRGTIHHPHIEGVRLTESAWTLWTWALWPIAATLFTCIVLCTCKRSKTEDYDCDALCEAGAPVWGAYLGWFLLVVSGITCFWFASGCSDLAAYAEENNIDIKEGYSYYYWTTTWGSSEDSNNYWVYPVCGAGGVGGGTVGLWVIGGIFIAFGVLGGALSIKCVL